MFAFDACSFYLKLQNLSAQGNSSIVGFWRVQSDEYQPSFEEFLSFRFQFYIHFLQILSDHPGLVMLSFYNFSLHFTLCGIYLNHIVTIYVIYLFNIWHLTEIVKSMLRICFVLGNI